MTSHSHCRGTSLLGALSLSTAIVATAGCAARDAGLPARGKWRPSHTVLKAGAWLHSAPDDSHPRARRHDLARRSPQRFGDGVVFRLLHIGSKWLELETSPITMASHCLRAPWFAQHVRLRLYARRADAQLVTRRRARSHYNDFTWVELAAGVPVQLIRTPPGARGGLYRAAPYPYHLETFLRSRDVGIGYRPSPRYRNERSQHHLARRARLRFGGTGAVGREQGASSSVPTLFVQQMSNDTPQPRVVVEDRCVKMRVRVQENDILGGEVRYPPHAADRANREPTETTLQSGAPLFWPDGTRAGEVTRALPLHGPIEHTRERLCFALPLTRTSAPRRDDTGALPLCALQSSRSASPAPGPVAN